MILDAFARLVDRPLFSRDYPMNRDWDVVAWWEVRRLPYNLIVGTAGVISSVAILATAYVTEKFVGETIGLPDPPMFAVAAAIFYGLMANICFTGGWILELVSRRIWGLRSAAFGEIAFVWGTLGSVLLTLTPAAIIVLAGAYAIVTHRAP